MTDDTTVSPTLGLHGDSCATCGAALNTDQRYCLSCGTRRAGAGLPFRQILATDVAPPATGVSPGSAAAASDPNRSSMPALASIACLLLALGVGVVIGNSKGSTETTVAPTAAAGTEARTDTTATDPNEKAATNKKASDDSAASAAASKASNPALKQLESLTPEQYQKQALKLPKTVSTGGKPPPKDNKAPANGGSFETIG